jgi:hypothetical protein
MPLRLAAEPKSNDKKRGNNRGEEDERHSGRSPRKTHPKSGRSPGEFKYSDGGRRGFHDTWHPRRSTKKTGELFPALLERWACNAKSKSCAEIGHEASVSGVLRIVKRIICRRK